MNLSFNTNLHLYHNYVILGHVVPDQARFIYLAGVTMVSSHLSSQESSFSSIESRTSYFLEPNTVSGFFQMSSAMMYGLHKSRVDVGQTDAKSFCSPAFLVPLTVGLHTRLLLLSHHHRGARPQPKSRPAHVKGKG